MNPLEKQQEKTPIFITEVGPRDGLQNEATSLSLKTKVQFINALSKTGVPEIEAGAFVSPKAIPKMADSDEVFRNISKIEGVTYSALVPNERGLDRALDVGVQKVAVFTAASNSFALHNIHSTVEESINRFRPVVVRARRNNLKTRGYISTAVFCPYEGRIPPSRVVDVMRQLVALGIEEIALGETLGKASPRDISLLLDHVYAEVPTVRVALHLHDTYGMAIANARTAWQQYGVVNFDASAGGLGGCPYAPGASGNVATENLVSAFKASGAVVSVDEIKVVEAVRPIFKELDRKMLSKPFNVAETTGKVRLAVP